MVLADRLVVVRDDDRVLDVPGLVAVLPEVTRRSLLDRLTGTRAALVVVCGPAGAGKSTLLRQWAVEDRRATVQVDLSPRHGSPAMLADAVVAALSTVGPDEHGARAAITDEEPAFSAVVVPGLGDVAASRARPYVLVLDDVHLLREPRAQQLIRSLADGVPDGSTLVLATRGAPPAWVARLRAEGRAVVVHPSDLAFDADEAAELVSGLGLPQDAASDLLRETDGWAVALHLAVLARMTDGDGGASYDDAGITDYLRSEVLDRLPCEQRDLLVRTSIVEAPTAELCDAVLDRDDSARLLRDAVRRTSLVREDHGVFRAHHLLLDTLRAELAGTVDADETAALHTRAGRWFLAQGDPETAVHHALLAHDMETVESAVGHAVPESAGSGRSDRLTRLLGQMSEEQIAGNPWLALAAAWGSLQRGDVDGRDRWTVHAEAHAGRGWRERVRTDSYAASLAVLLAMVGRDGVAATAQLCEDALVGLAPDDPFRCPASFLLAVSRTIQEQPGAVELLVEGRRLARALSVAVNAADTLAFEGMLTLMRGDVAAGLALIDEAAAVVAEHQADRLATAAHPLSAYALSLAIQGRRAEGARVLAQARRLTHQLQGLVPWFQVLARLVQGRAALLLGDVPLARELASEARQALTPDLAATTLSGSLAELEEMLRRAAGSAGGGVTLTPAELRVLAYLPSHLTFPQIGEHLFLSASTVKTHALSIYRKLGVGSRAAAVDTARSLGLVEAGLRG